MKKGRFSGVVQAFGILCSAALIAFNYTPAMRQLRDLPSMIRVHPEDESIALPELLGNSFFTKSDSAITVSSVKDERLSNVADTVISYDLFGILPLKTVEVIHTQDIYLVPGGSAVGITIRTQGVLVVGLGTVDTAQGALSPGAAAGIQAGDVILRADGQNVENADQLARMAKRSDGTMQLELEREQETVQATIQLVQDVDDGENKIGLWVRDSTAGVGTLSFVDHQTGWFAALGHPVSDIDTQSLLTVREGKVIPTEIVDIKKGEQGSPGELIGVFSVSGPSMGSIKKNTEYGIFGKTEQTYQNPLYSEIPLGYAGEAHTGKAKLLATISKDGVEEYECEVVRVNPQTDAATKGMVIHITDQRLLDKTGGIVQGMSGCPVIQDGRLIAVVTHVFVNDPTRGYCVYAEWMRSKMLDAVS